jgi:hypothetical protein
VKCFFVLFSFSLVLFSCDYGKEKDNFSGTWQLISSNVNGHREMPKDTINGVLKKADKNVYIFYFSGTSFSLDKIDANTLVGNTENIKYIDKNNHIIFDMGVGKSGKGYFGATGESIMEFKKLN